MSRLTFCTVRLVQHEYMNRCVLLQTLPKKILNPTLPMQTHFHISANMLSKEIQNTEKPTVELTEDNFVQKLYKKFFRGIPKTKLKATGYILLTHCVQQPQLEKFFRVFDMPDTFYSWFLVSELHVWMLSCRLMNEGEYGRQVRNAMVEALWQDCEQRAKSIGDLPASIRSKQILGISEEFQAALFVYDEGLLGGDKELANALWRRFFLSMRDSEEKQTPDMEKLALLVDYVRRTMHHLDNIDAVSLIIKAQVSWLSVEENLTS